MSNWQQEYQDKRCWCCLLKVYINIESALCLAANKPPKIYFRRLFFRRHFGETTLVSPCAFPNRTAF